MISDIREDPQKELIKNDHIQDGRGVNNCQFEIRVFLSYGGYSNRQFYMFN